GRPDYLLDDRGRTVPVEVKPGRRAAQPYLGDVMQLAAYGLLLEEVTGEMPPYGLLRYSNATFEVPFNRDLFQKVLELLGEMEGVRQEKEVPRSHNDATRCAACGLRYACGEWAL
ncbi:MAG: CRISPR-associated protein Cas4, partial [Bryobacteraceae bacterium]